mgnify:CR=1 FL=1|jgi:hypothetical protein
MEESLQVLMENAPGAGAVIVTVYLFLKDRKSLVEQHYLTISALFDKVDETNKTLLGSQKEQSELMGKTLVVNQDMLKGFQEVTEGFQGVAKGLEDLIRNSQSELKEEEGMDSKAIRRAVEEMREELDDHKRAEIRNL